LLILPGNGKEKAKSEIIARPTIRIACWKKKKKEEKNECARTRGDESKMQNRRLHLVETRTRCARTRESRVHVLCAA